MRKMILLGAMGLLSAAAAQAGESRGLSLARTDSPVITAPKPIEPQRTAEVTVLPAPLPVAPQQPVAAPVAAAPVAAAAPTPTAATAPAPTVAAAAPPQPAATAASTPSRRRAARDARPRTKRWSEARIVSELHRHGIYW